MTFRSAIHYPHSRVTNPATMRAALLLWDEYHIIAPWPDFDPQHEGEIGEAWSQIGRITVPHEIDQKQAHNDILTFIEHRQDLHPNFFLSANKKTIPADMYEIYPQKLLGETWWELERAGLAGDLLPNNDRPMSSWGGLVIMAKLADACAGRVFARVTDRSDAYRAIATETRTTNRHDQNAASTVPVLLNLIQASSIPVENLMRFRENKRNDPLRHNLLDAVGDHLQKLQELDSPNQIGNLQRQFDYDMRRNLADLKDALRFNKIKFATSAAVLTMATGAFAMAAALQSGPLQIGHALSAAGTTGLGLKQVFDFFGGGLDLSDKQRNTMAKNPMAYMRLLSKHRVAT